MTQMMGPLDQALTHGDRQVVSTAYKELQALFARIDRWAEPGAPGKHEGVSVNNNALAHDEHALVGPLSALANLLTREQDAIESVRKGRAEVVLAYLRLRPTIRGKAAMVEAAVREWRQNERSSSIQRILDEALARV